MRTAYLLQGPWFVLSLSCLAARAALSEEAFDWDAVEPSSHIRYHDCYDGFRCARLTVPLEWHDPSSPKTVALALVTLPSTVAPTSPSFGGTIVTNPGGPGGSGVLNLLAEGRILQSLVDNHNKHYEILSFDPRGVAHSTPSADCYPDEFTRSTVNAQFRAMNDLNDDPAILPWHFARAAAHGRLCAEAKASLAPFMSTAMVARDMLEIVERVHELRTTRGDFISVMDERDDGQHPLESGRVVPPEESRQEPRLQYLGFSYGTILGNTFASMYPGRVKRMVLDGVADPHDYTDGLWRKNMNDVEKVADVFYTRCFDVGTDCALYQPSDHSSSDIRARVNAMIRTLQSKPASVIVDGVPTMITATDIRTIMQIPFYEPLLLFPRLAQELASAMQGNFSLLSQRLAVPKASQICSRPGRQRSFAYSWAQDASTTYLCNDGADAAERNMSYYTEYIRYLKTQSPSLGPLWAQLAVECKGWQMRPKWRFTGPFRTPGPDSRLVSGRPAAPLLFLSARDDPATPVMNAAEATRHHPGSSCLSKNRRGIVLRRRQALARKRSWRSTLSLVLSLRTGRSVKQTANHGKSVRGRRRALLDTRPLASSGGHDFQPISDSWPLVINNTVAITRLMPAVLNGRFEEARTIF